MQKPENLVIVGNVTLPVSGTFSPVSLCAEEQRQGRPLGQHKPLLGRGGGCTHDVRHPVAFVSWMLFLLFPFLVDPSSEEHTVCLELVVPSLRAARQRDILHH